MWFYLAQHNGLDASNVIVYVEKKMTSNDINEAQTMSKLCLGSNYTKCD